MPRRTYRPWKTDSDYGGKIPPPGESWSSNIVLVPDRELVEGQVTSTLADFIQSELGLNASLNGNEIRVTGEFEFFQESPQNVNVIMKLNFEDISEDRVKVDLTITGSVAQKRSGFFADPNINKHLAWCDRGALVLDLIDLFEDAIHVVDEWEVAKLHLHGRYPDRYPDPLRSPDD